MDGVGIGLVLATQHMVSIGIVLKEWIHLVIVMLELAMDMELKHGQYISEVT